MLPYTAISATVVEKNAFLLLWINLNLVAFFLQFHDFHQDVYLFSAFQVFREKLNWMILILLA